MKKLVRTTNLKRSRELPLLDGKLIDVKPPDISTALLLSQSFLCLMLGRLTQPLVDGKSGQGALSPSDNWIKETQRTLVVQGLRMCGALGLPKSSFVLLLSNSNFLSRYEVFGLTAKNLFFPGS